MEIELALEDFLLKDSKEELVVVLADNDDDVAAKVVAAENSSNEGHEGHKDMEDMMEAAKEALEVQGAELEADVKEVDGDFEEAPREELTDAVIEAKVEE